MNDGRRRPHRSRSSATVVSISLIEVRFLQILSFSRSGSDARGTVATTMSLAWRLLGNVQLALTIRHEGSSLPEGASVGRPVFRFLASWAFRGDDLRLPLLKIEINQQLGSKVRVLTHTYSHINNTLILTLPDPTIPFFTWNRGYRCLTWFSTRLGDFLFQFHSKQISTDVPDNGIR